MEIGSYLGASTCYIGAGLRGKHSLVVCVDTWENQTMPEGKLDTFSTFERNVAGIRHKLQLLRKTSGSLTSDDLCRTFGMIFIDGDHSYCQTRSDFEIAAKVLETDGLLVFHDCLFFEGVSRVIGEALSSGKWQIGGNVRNLFWLKRAHFEHKS
jgi:predicted O-methyltransferase YrrM